jgi:hypothetical protein
MKDDDTRINNVKVYASETISMTFDPFGWLVVTFCEERGSVQIQSDWGNVAFVWFQKNTGIEGEHALKRFFAYTGVHYLLDKFSYDQKKLKTVIDADKTMAALKEHVLEYRRDGSMDKEEAREIWDELELYDDELRAYDGEYDMNANYNSWYEHMSQHFDELYEHIATRESPMHRSYREIVIPTIQRWLVDQGHKR